MDEFHLDTREFNRAAEQLIEHSERTYPQFINGQLLAVASRALRSTAAASADKIALAMGQIATQKSVSKKSGKVRFTRIYRTDLDSFAHRIVNARRKKAGQSMIWGDQLDQAARKMIGARLRAVSFIRSGWVYAIRQLSRIVGYAERTGAARMTGQAKGFAVPAEFAINSIVEGKICNTALLTRSKSGAHGDPMPVAVMGLQAALDETALDMMDHLAGKLQPVFDRHSAK